ncbi:hypothetical protein [Burkholderia pseudomallei]|uniref:hypothetical protein n=1 Tax=Burkholderia pseudomallei TaxID=28450 RepID=UPI0027E0B706|nr:hypothetical protein [Burkholderia pseudomallei]
MNGISAQSWQERVAKRIISLIKESLFAKVILGLAVAYYLAAVIGPVTGKVDTTWYQWFPVVSVHQNPAECLWIKDQQTGNSCDFAVTATELEVVQNGITQNVPCSGPLCTLPAHSQGPIVAPAGVTINKVLAARR